MKSHTDPSLEGNPLVTRHARLPFDRIRPDHVEPAIAHLLDRSRAALEAVAEQPGPRTFANTLLAYDRATEPLEEAYGLVNHLQGLLGDPDLRAAYNAVHPKVSGFFAAIPHDPKLWAALSAYAASDEAQGLDPVRARLLDETLAGFRRQGADLEPEAKARLEKIDVELAELTNAYAQAVVDATDAFEWVAEDEAQLAGLPESARAAARAAAERRGVAGWRFGLDGPSYTSIMTHLDDAAVRERFWRAYTTRATAAPHDNRPRVARILELRRARAGLLGYPDIADLLTERRMAKSGAAAAEFIRTLEGRSVEAAAADHAALLAFRRELEGPDAPPIEPWSLAYYAEKLRKARFDLDDEALRPWFEADRVIEGLYAIVGKLYGVRFTRLDDHPVWHEAVRVYAVEEGDRRLGVFYVDLHPRDGKRGGAWMRPLRFGDPAKGEPHVGVIAANLTPPGPDRPALLEPREVETVFHEFGHLLHSLLTTVELRPLAGTSVAWDFVELPSQIMENWCRQRPALNLFARHYETGAPLPDTLLEKMEAARTFRKAYQMLRQLGFATVDLALHRDYDPARDGDVMAYARTVLARFTPTALPDDYAMIAAFPHLFANPVGYAAGYYSYKWAEVLDADAFTRFAGDKLFDREVGLAFRREILARGNSRDPAESYAAFMGRGPDIEPLFARAGIAPPAPVAGGR